MEPAAAAGPGGPDATVDDELGGSDLGRIIALSDGIFAFAMTLLALSLTVPVFRNAQGVPLDPGTIPSPELAHALLGEGSAFLTYAFGFFIIAFWWEAHHRIFAHVHRWDRRVLSFNLAFLLMIAVTPFLVSLYAQFGADQAALVLYAGAQGLGGLVLAALWEHATRAPGLTGPDLPGTLVARYRARLFGSSAIFGASILVSFVNVRAAEFVWLTVFFLGWLQTTRLRRSRGRTRPTAVSRA